MDDFTPRIDTILSNNNYTAMRYPKVVQFLNDLKDPDFCAMQFELNTSYFSIGDGFVLNPKLEYNDNAELLISETLDRIIKDIQERKQRSAYEQTYNTGNRGTFPCFSRDASFTRDACSTRYIHNNTNIHNITNSLDNNLAIVELKIFRQELQDHINKLKDRLGSRQLP